MVLAAGRFRGGEQPVYLPVPDVYERGRHVGIRLSNIETLIINGSNNIIIIEGGVITMIIKGNDNKILTGKDSFGIQNTIFQGNDNRIIIKNPSANINIIDNGYYNSVFRKKKINKEIKVHLNIKIEKLLTKKRNLNLELKLEQC